ncbi:MAG: ComF family protein [Dehalococcoidia bacterium]|nr:ComF family protein [Dehalococcoidia bacterium]MYD29801.1 ComF family protein [Dehalococcoidia bacterium]
MRELISLSVANAWDAMRNEDPVGAFEWLANVPEGDEEILRSQVHYALGKRAMSEGRWPVAEEQFGQASRLASMPTAQVRVGLLRKRSPLLSSATWMKLRTTVDPPDRLPHDGAAPLASIWACGAYYAWHKRGAPWSRFVRMAKKPSDDHEDRAALTKLGAGFMCRYILEETPLLREVDAVVPVPADPQRYSERLFSLPDELASAIQSQLAVPQVRKALRHTGTGVELRGLSWSERRRAVRELLEIGEYDSERWPSVLVVDDVITSGATMKECARLLLAGGAKAVHGVALAHTEG